MRHLFNGSWLPLQDRFDPPGHSPAAQAPGTPGEPAQAEGLAVVVAEGVAVVQVQDTLSGALW